jgi:hypothetical protein
MTGGNLLYLVMCLGTFAAFSGVLYYASSQQGHAEPPASQTPAASPDAGGPKTG